MLFYLYTLLNINILQYISFRAGIAFLLSFCFCIYLMPRFIKWAKSKNVSQPISKYILTHKNKSNTPTMGGVIFIACTIFTTLLCANLSNYYILVGITILITFSLIGIKDDYLKINRKNNEGISVKSKMLFLITASITFSICLFMMGHDSYLYIPFLKQPMFDMGSFAIAFWAFIFIATSNAVNITDGLDGLATMPSIFAITTLSIFVYVSGHAVFSLYLLIPKIINSGELVVLSSALIGSLFGFLWYNCQPAQVFMGDSGSLSLGAFISYMAIISNSEFLLILIGFIFVIETLSVIFQISSYKIRNKKIFLMAPIHHHFEVKGWSENKIIIRFWIIALLSNLLALLSLKIR